jgi:hypothetical protein
VSRKLLTGLIGRSDGGTEEEVHNQTPASPEDASANVNDP